MDIERPKRYDVGFHKPDGSIHWVARGVSREEAQDVAFDMRKPKGAKSVIRPRGV
jgi:hypothetical protein